MEQKFCQSCGMPLIDPKEFGTERDGNRNADYCKYCYENGEFSAKCTMDEMIDFCLPFVLRVHPEQTSETVKAQMKSWFPTLKRWQK